MAGEFFDWGLVVVQDHEPVDPPGDFGDDADRETEVGDDHRAVQILGRRHLILVRVQDRVVRRGTVEEPRRGVPVGASAVVDDVVDVQSVHWVLQAA